MKSSLIACFAAVALLAACSDDKSNAAAGAGGANAGMGPGGIGGGGIGGGGLNPGGAGRGAPGSQEDLAQSAGDRVFFDTDQSRLNDQARAVLERQVAWLRQSPQVKVWVAGNCDERGTEEYNLALGQRRANAAQAFLLANGIARARVETISYGKQRPINSSSSPTAWGENRNAITSVK
jgi:peptidoglycan-associated lipoprotein